MLYFILAALLLVGSYIVALSTINQVRDGITVFLLGLCGMVILWIMGLQQLREQP